MEAPQVRTPADEYASALHDAIRAASAWSIESRGDASFAWTHFSPPDIDLPAEGWKVHVSCAAVEAARMCRTLLPTLIARRVPFKLPATLRFVVSLNGGDCGETQLGKVLTIYPGDAASASSIAEDFDRLWPTSRGPVIPTDVTLRPGGAVGLRYGVIGSAPLLVKANGSEEPALRGPGGELVEDVREAYRRSPSWVPPLTIPTFEPISPTLPKRIEGVGLELVPIATLHRTARTTVMLALDGARLERVILKTGHRGVFGDEHGRDMGDALRREFEILRELPPNIGPRALGLLEVNGHVVLVEEDLGGISSNNLPLEQQQKKLHELALLIDALHAMGLVHRDVKPLNVLSTDKGLRLIDFEISARVGDADVVCAGTDGYAPPESRGDAANPAADRYALGAMIAASYLGYDPGGLPSGPGRIVGLMKAVGSDGPSELVAELIARDPARRPSARDAADRLRTITTSSKRRASAAPRVSEAEAQRFAVRAAIAASLSTETYRTGRSPFWHLPHPTQNSRAESIANGVSGVLLGLASVERVAPAPWLRERIAAATEWLAAQDPQRGVDGLWVGNAGVALVLGVLGHRLGREDVLARAEVRLRAAADHESEADLYSGHAGIAWSACLLASAIGADWPLSVAETQVRKLLRRLQVKQGVPVWEPSELVGESSAVLGAAHGSAGNAVALAAWGRQCDRPEALVVAAEIFRSLYRAGRTADGTALRYTLGGRAAGSGEWCHGAAGYLWSLLVSFGDDPSLRDELDWAVGALQRTGIITNPTCCHGLAGRLELWQLLKSVPRYADLARQKATEIVQVLRLLRQRTRGVCAWGSEKTSVITPCLWVGFMGTATALARYAADREDALFSPSWLAEIAHRDAVARARPHPAFQMSYPHMTSNSAFGAP